VLPLVAAIVLAINLHQQKPDFGPGFLFAIIFVTATLTAGAFVLMLAPMLVSVLLLNRRGTHAAETHAYSLTDAGLYCESASSNTLLKWGGARSLDKSKSAIYIRLSACSYFFLPRHLFASDDEYESFWLAIQKLLRTRHSS
jgi:hypothetical protein